MPDDRKKKLEALVAKRKAEAESGEKNKRLKAPSLPSAKSVSKPVTKTVEKLGSKAKISPASAKSKHKEVAKPKRSSKLDEYEIDDDDDEEEEDFTAESDEEEDELSNEDSEDDQKAKSMKKPSFDSKGKFTVGSSNGRGDDDKGKSVMKDKGKSKAKVSTSSSEDEGSDGDDGGDLSDDPLTEVDPSNILPSRTRRQAYQPGAYHYNSVNGDAEDEDDDDSD